MTPHQYPFIQWFGLSKRSPPDTPSDQKKKGVIAIDAIMKSGVSSLRKKHPHHPSTPSIEKTSLTAYHHPFVTQDHMK